MTKLFFLQISPFVITACVLGYGYYNNRKKDKNKEDKLYKDSESQIEYYKSIYRPIKNDNRLPSIKKNGWELEDIAKNATIFCYSSPIPTAQEISNLKKGDLVKLNFVDKDGEVERMWVIYDKSEAGLHFGHLDNDPFEMDGLNYQNEIWFHSNHILLIDFES